MEKPVVFEASVQSDELEALRLDPTVTFVDTLEEQLHDWVTALFPRLKNDERGRVEAIDRILGGLPRTEFGSYVYFPWSRHLVRLLPEAAFRELRCDRNRNKITRREQAILASKKVAIAGLSVGLAVATTLAQEGVGGHFVLADFDTLAVSNLNRLQAPLAWVGLPKTTIAARKIREIDPFAAVTLLPEGVTDGNLDHFLDGVDLLVEECDSLGLKLRLREAARARRIPVVMETSDAGMLDVERFDREPERPIFHGRTDGIDSKTLDRLTSKEKVPLFLRIVPPERMTSRMAASLIDIDTTISSWPQLASAVVLGGAVVTDTVRRIFLNEFEASGRFYIDLRKIVAAENDVAEEPPTPLPGGRAPGTPAQAVVDPERDRPTLVGARDTRSELRFLAEAAHRAPSAGNAQPWWFTGEMDALCIHHDRSRDARMAPYGRFPSFLALGAAAENAVLAAATLGYRATVSLENTDDHAVVRVSLGPRGDVPPGAAATFEKALARTTNRRRSLKRTPLADGAHAALVEAAGPASLRLFTDPSALGTLGEILGRVDRGRWVEESLHEEIVKELRRDRDDAIATGDGLELASLELSAADAAGLAVLVHRRHLDAIRAVDGGLGLAVGSTDDLVASDAFAVLEGDLGDENAPETWLNGGRIVARVWTAANALGLSVHPHAAPFLFRRQEDSRTAPDRVPALEGVVDGWLDGARRDFRQIIPRVPNVIPLLAFRLTAAPPATARAFRRPLGDVLRDGL